MAGSTPNENQNDRTTTWIGFVPNTLSALRLVIAAAFPFVAPMPLRLVLVVAGGLSDGLDGFIARRYGVTSVAGGLLDGIADKAFTLSVLATLAARGEIAWWQAGLVLARDITIGLVAAYGAAIRDWATFQRVVPRVFGKLTTLLVFTWFVALHVPAASPLLPGLFLAAAAASGAAALDYLACFAREMRARSGP